MADAECFSGGSIAGAVIGTFVATLVLGAFLLFLWNQYRKHRARSSPLHDLVMVEDGDRREEAKKNFGYDNPGFFDDSTDPKKTHSQSYGIRQNGTGKQVANQESTGKSKHLPWGPLTFLFNRGAKNTLDDSALEEPQVYTASLKGHDFTGLGFNICGNMRDGIFIKDIMQRGPAAESKKILPGDRITSLTISFKHIVLDDALTLLSYASPYDVSLDMLRLPEKSLSHKGIHLLSSGSSHLSSGQGSSSPTTDMVCHPFFKSQSIDDLRKVGREHLSCKDDGIKKKENGVKSQTSLLVVAPKETRSSKTQAKNKAESNEPSKRSPKPSSSPKPRDVAVTITPDETDKGPRMVQQANVKPELVPRVKSKTITVKSEAMPPPGIVEAISPVVKMINEDTSESQPQTQPVAIVKPTRNSVKIACAEIPDPVLQHMAIVSSKSPMPLAVTPSDVSITIDQEEINVCPIEKPKRQKKSLLNVLKEKTNHETEKKQKLEANDSAAVEKHEKEPEKSRLGKFGIRVLPDISLNFGKKSPEKEKEEGEQKPTASPKKEKSTKEKTKDKKSEDATTKAVSKEQIDDVELDLSLAVPKTSDAVVQSTESPNLEDSTTRSSDERPPSTDSLDSTEKPTSRKSSGFHLPSIGIKLPKFGHSKQYNLEPEDDGLGHSEHSTPISKTDRHSNISSSVIVKKLDDTDEMNVTIESVTQLPSPDIDALDRSAEKTDLKEESKQKPGFMSKGLQGLRDFKDKVSHKLSSSHDSPSSSSSDDEEQKAGGAANDEAKRAKKEKREARAAAKLREKQEKEEKSKEKAREKERLKAEKLAKKAELKRKSSKQADQSSEISSAEDSDQDDNHQSRKKSKPKGKKVKNAQSNEALDNKSEIPSKTSKETDDVEKIESAEMIQETTKTSSTSQMQSIKSKLIPAKPPVAPRKSTDSSRKETDKEDSDEKSKRKPKRSRRECSGSAKSSSSSNSSSDGSDSEGKVNKLAKRQAPTPPVAGEATKGNIVVTKAEVTEAPRDVHQCSTLPEIVEATVKPKSKIPVKIPVTNADTTRSRTPDKRSASFADLSSLQSPPKSKSKIDSLERAVSMDMATEDDGSNARCSHIPNMVMSPVEDLSTATDSTMTTAPHYKHSQQSFSSSGSSSSETLKASPNSVVHVVQHQAPTNSETIRTIDVHKMVQDTVTMINTGVHLREGSHHSSTAIPLPHNQVTISTTGTSMTDDSEMRNVAKVAVDEILARVNSPADEDEVASRANDENKMSIDITDRTTNVTIMNVRNVTEMSTSALDIQIDDSTAASKSDSKKLLRGDSKSRLMQLVADANEIKITQKSSQPKKDSSSPQVSPEIQSDNKPLFPEPKAHANGTNSSPLSQPVNGSGQTIEITATELDGIMMSHSEFLARQAVLYPIETLPKESSFDNWVYVDQKHSVSTSPPEPTSTDGDRSSSHRNGALSPTTYKTATEFETSELKVTTSSPISTADSAFKPSKVYSTTMTLPQKTITQIILGPESGQNIEITSPLPTFK